MPDQAQSARYLRSASPNMSSLSQSVLSTRVGMVQTNSGAGNQIKFWPLVAQEILTLLGDRVPEGMSFLNIFSLLEFREQTTGAQCVSMHLRTDHVMTFS